MNRRAPELRSKTRSRRAGLVRAAALFLVASGLTVSYGLAHHVLGIPHYKYGDDYPQIPYLEVIAQAGPYDLSFTHFPGFPRPGERIRLKLYVRDRETGTPYLDPLHVELFRRRFLWGSTPAGAPITIHPGVGPERNDYKFYLTFDEAEAYEIRVHFPNGDQLEVIPFPVVVGKTDDRPLIFAAAGLLAAAVVSVAAVKRRRRSLRTRARRKP